MADPLMSGMSGAPVMAPRVKSRAGSSTSDYHAAAASAASPAATTPSVTATRRTSNTNLSSPPLSPSVAAAERLALRAELDRLTARAAAAASRRTSAPEETPGPRREQREQRLPPSQDALGPNRRSQPRGLKPPGRAGPSMHRRAVSACLEGSLGSESPSAVSSAGPHHKQLLHDQDQDQDYLHHSGRITSDFSIQPSSDSSRPQSSPSTAPESRQHSSQSPLSTASYFTLPKSSSREVRSPFYKKSPASRSAHGIDTAYGPPPAISTQRSSVTLWTAGNTPQKQPKLTPNALARLNAANRAPRTSSTVSAADISTSVSNLRESDVASGSGINADVQSSSTFESANEVLEFVDDDPELLRVEEIMASAIPRRSTGGSRLQDMRDARARYEKQREQEAQPRVGAQAQEDMFLKMAQTENREDASADNRSRVSTSSRFRNPENMTPLNTKVTRDTRMSDRMSDRISTSGRANERDRRLSIPGEGRSPAVPKFSNSPLAVDDARRRRVSELRPPLTASRAEFSTDSSFDTSPVHARRSSLMDSSSIARPGAYRKSHLSHATNHQRVNTSPVTPRYDSTEEGEAESAPRSKRSASVVSGGAQSTVWDELDDLRLRIAKLEFTGRLPPSASAMGANLTERPRTATTHTSTTMSSSPKRSNGQVSNISPITSNGFDEPAPLHPILHSALARSKNLLEAGPYHALEAVAADALTLVKLTSQFSDQYSTSRDRQLKRKADNMCRSLTELCLALNNRSSYANHNGSASASASQSASSSHVTDEYDPEYQPRNRNRDSQNTITLFNGGGRVANQHVNAVRQTDRPSRSHSLEPEFAGAVPEASNASRVNTRMLSRLEARRNDVFGTSAEDARFQQPARRQVPSAEVSPSRGNYERATSRLADVQNSEEYSESTTPTLNAATRNDYLQAYGGATNYVSGALDRSADVLSRVRRSSTVKDNRSYVSQQADGNDDLATLRAIGRVKKPTTDPSEIFGGNPRSVSGVTIKPSRSPERDVNRENSGGLTRSSSLKDKRASREYTSDYPLPASRLTRQELHRRAEQIEATREKRRSGLSGISAGMLPGVAPRRERGSDAQL